MPDLPREIEDRQGHRIDLTRPRWSAFGADGDIRIGELPIKNVVIRRAVELFIVERLRYRAPRTALLTFDRLLKLSMSQSFRFADEVGGTLPASIVREVGHAVKAAGITNYMNYEADIRYWYIWCADMGFPHFDRDIATELEALVIGGNAKGLAVLSNDPNKGPLSSADFNAL